MIHIDVMDGHFVPNLTYGPTIVEAVCRSATVPVEVHLMIEEPERSLEDYCRLGAEIVTVAIRRVHARAITLRGPGASLLTLDGQNAVHLLEVNAGTASAGVPVSGPVHISGLAFANGTTAVDGGVNMNGNSGSVGGIANWGTLTLDDVKVTGMWAGNVGAGIGNGPAGRLTIVRSEVSGNSTGWRGGGIYNSPDGVITIDRSTIANNTVREGEFGHSGGGVASYGALTIDRSTLSGNQVFSSACHGNVCGGGGIAAGFGGPNASSSIS